MLAFAGSFLVVLPQTFRFKLVDKMASAAAPRAYLLAFSDLSRFSAVAVGVAETRS